MAMSYSNGNPSLKGALSTIKGYEKPPSIRPKYMRTQPKDSSSVAVSTSQLQTHWNLPTSHRYGDDLCLKATLAAGGVVGGTVGARNCILTVTQNAAITSGTFRLGFFNRETKIYSQTADLIFSTSAALIKAALEGLESFKTKEGTAMTVTVSAAFSAGAAVTFTFSGEAAQVGFDADQLTFASSDDETVTSVVVTVSTTASETHLESILAAIDRIRVNIGGVEVINLEQAGRFMTHKLKANATKEFYDTWGRLMGFGTVQQRIRDNVSGRTYIIPLYWFFDFFEHVLPTLPELISSNQLEIEIYWQASAQCCVSPVETGTVTYTLSDLELLSTHLDEGSQKPKNMPSSIPFTNVYLERDSISANATNHKIKISRGVRSMNRMWYSQQYSADLTLLTVYDKVGGSIKSGITSYQARINGMLNPQQSVDSDAQSFKRYLTNSCDYGKNKGGSGLITYSQYISDTSPNFYSTNEIFPGRCHLIVENYVIPHIRGKQMSYRGGGENLVGNSDSQLEIVKTADASIITTFLFVEHDSKVEIRNGTVNRLD